jgi:protein SCO1/2
MTETTPALAFPPARWRWRTLLSLLLVGALAACGTREPPFALKDITGLMPRLEFKLVNQDGMQVTADDFRDQIVLLYFGYTQCPDACPTTLASLERALHELGPASARQIRVLFVSVDPQRDTAAVLRRYVGSFGPQFTGLTGDDAALTALTKRYRVAYSCDKPDANGYYAVAHSSAVFVFQKGGTPRLLARDEDSSHAIAEDLRRLLASR